MNYILNKTIYCLENILVFQKEFFILTFYCLILFLYLVTLIKSKQNDKYCWKESQIEVDLSNSNKTIQFEQTGLKLRIHLQTSNRVVLVRMKNIELFFQPISIICSFRK